MTVSETLKQIWNAAVAEALQAEGYYHRRVPLACVWPVHAGIHRPTDARVLILETELKLVRGLRLKDETKGYSIDVGPDEAGRSDRATILIQETNPVYREIFTIFCADILEHWIPHASATDAIKSLSRRLARWKKFFQRGAFLGLNREDYVGLYGELSLIEAGLNRGVASLPIVKHGRPRSAQIRTFFSARLRWKSRQPQATKLTKSGSQMPGSWIPPASRPYSWHALLSIFVRVVAERSRNSSRP